MLAQDVIKRFIKEYRELYLKLNRRLLMSEDQSLDSFVEEYMNKNLFLYQKNILNSSLREGKKGIFIYRSSRLI